MAVMTTALTARTRLAALPTPLVQAPRLAETLGTGPLYVKHEDLTGFAFAGNKARPLVPRYAGGGNVVFWHTGGQLDAVAVAAEAYR